MDAAEEKHLKDRLFIMLRGPLFPAVPIGDEGKEWSDKEFFNSMWKKLGKWTPKQIALLKKRFAYYDKHGRKLYGVKEELKECKLCSITTSTKAEESPMAEQKGTAVQVAPQMAVTNFDQEAGPRKIVERGLEYAKVLAEVIEKKHLFKEINGKKYVRVEGWQLLGSFMQISPREKQVTFDGKDFEAVIELVNTRTGVVVGQGSARCGQADKAWKGRELNAQRSMAITRAVSKAFRNSFSWIMALTDGGFEVTPAEEMDLTPKGDNKTFNIEDAEDLEWFKEQPSVQAIEDRSVAKKVAAVLHGRPRSDLEKVVAEVGTPRPITDFEVP